jgi:hypothetical protein
MGVAWVVEFIVVQIGRKSHDLPVLNFMMYPF